MDYKKIYLIRDSGIIALSIVLAIALAKTGVLDNILIAAAGIKFVSSFLAGLFFTSMFTAAPATVVLAELAASNSAWEVAFFGGLGALAGDLIVFRFVRNYLSEDIISFIRGGRWKRLKAIFRIKVFSWFLPFLGALIIASPFPDELGIALMGFSKIRPAVFIPISFLLNGFGILIIGMAARYLL